MCLACLRNNQETCIDGTRGVRREQWETEAHSLWVRSQRASQVFIRTWALTLSETVRVLSRGGNCLTRFKRIPLAPTLRIGWWRRGGSGRCRSRGDCGRLIAVAQARNS